MHEPAASVWREDAPPANRRLPESDLRVDSRIVIVLHIFYPLHNSFVQYIVLLSLTGLSKIHLFCAILDRYVFHARIKHKHLSLYSCNWLNKSRLLQKLHINYIFDFMIN